MAKKPPFNTYLPPETHWEIRRLAKLWDISIAEATQKAIHYIGAVCRKSSDRSISDTAKDRFYEAGRELLAIQKKEAGHGDIASERAE